VSAEIDAIRRRLPGLMHQWYGRDVPVLLAALDEVNTELNMSRERADLLRDLYIDLRGSTQRALGILDGPRSMAEHDVVVDELIAAIAHRRAEATLRKVCEKCAACDACVLAAAVRPAEH
jgi:hypothetical protein